MILFPARISGKPKFQKLKGWLNQIPTEVRSVLESSHLEWIENREREQQLRDERFVDKFLAAKFRQASDSGVLDSAEVERYAATAVDAAPGILGGSTGIMAACLDFNGKPDNVDAPPSAFQKDRY